LRKNCNFIVHNLCELLFEKRFKFYSYTTPSYKNPGAWCYKKGEDTGPSEYNSNYYKGNLVLLVNHQTQSIGEFTAMALCQHPNSIIIGSPTAGTDGNVSKISLPGKIETYISGIGIYWVDGQETQRVGINPDITVQNRVKHIKNNEDIILNTALNFLNSKN
jgi:C-terminal processing protease CtpA/Prc